MCVILQSVLDQTVSCWGTVAWTTRVCTTEPVLMIRTTCSASPAPAPQVRLYLLGHNVRVHPNRTSEMDARWQWLSLRICTIQKPIVFSSSHLALFWTDVFCFAGYMGPICNDTDDYCAIISCANSEPCVNVVEEMRGICLCGALKAPVDCSKGTIQQTKTITKSSFDVCLHLTSFLCSSKSPTKLN